MILYTVKETADKLGVSTKTVRNRMKDRQLSYFKLGGLIRISDEQIGDYLGLGLMSADLMAGPSGRGSDAGTLSTGVRSLPPVTTRKPPLTCSDSIE